MTDGRLALMQMMTSSSTTICAFNCGKHFTITWKSKKLIVFLAQKPRKNKKSSERGEWKKSYKIMQNIYSYSTLTSRDGGAKHRCGDDNFPTHSAWLSTQFTRRRHHLNPLRLLENLLCAIFLPSSFVFLS